MSNNANTTKQLKEKDAQIAALSAKLKNLEEAIILERQTNISIISQIGRNFLGYNNSFKKELKNSVNKLNTNESFLKQIDNLLELQNMLLDESKNMNHFLGKIDIYLTSIPQTITKASALPLEIRNKAQDILEHKRELNNTERILQVLELIVQTIEMLNSIATLHKENFVPQPEMIEITQVINGIELPNELNKELMHYRENLKTTIPYTQAPSILLKIIAILIKSVNSERLHITSFLSGLNNQINSIQNSISKNFQNNTSVFTAQKENYNLINIELAQVAEDNEKCLDINELSSSIKERLSNINKLILEKDSYLNLQEKFLDDLNNIEHQISAVKEEAKTFRDGIKELANRNMIDNLTGLNNFYSFLIRLEQDIKNLKGPNKVPITIGIINLDQFSQFNTRYNFNVGDKILRVVGLTIKKQVRETDFVARLGSDHYGVIFYGVTSQNVQQLFLNVISAIKAIPFHYKNEKVTVTASVYGTEIANDAKPQQLIENLEEQFINHKKQNPTCSSQLLIMQLEGSLV